MTTPHIASAPADRTTVSPPDERKIRPPAHPAPALSRRTIMLGSVASVASAAAVAAFPEPSIAEPMVAPAISADAALLVAAERCVAAYKAHKDICDRDTRLYTTAMRRIPRPKVLRVRKSDEAMGLLRGCSGWKWFEHPTEVDPLREERWDGGEWERVETDEYYGSIRRWVKPSSEARARADEVIAAFDKWWAKAKPLKEEAEAEINEEIADEACDRSHQTEKEVAELSATTIEGLIAKARSLAAVFGGEPLEPGTNLLECELTVSLIKDLLRLATTREDKGLPATAEQIAAIEFAAVPEIKAMSREEAAKLVHANVADVNNYAIFAMTSLLAMDKKEFVELVDRGHDTFGPALMEFAKARETADFLRETIQMAEVRLACALAVVEGPHLVAAE